MALDHIFKDVAYIQSCGWGKVLSHLKKQFDKWAVERLAQKGYKGFKMTYMPVIMNIDLNGTNNNDLAVRAKVTKQAMSKVIKELQKSGFISSRTDPNDKRSVIFQLTTKGKSFIMSARESVGELMNEYRKEFGKKTFDDLLHKLVAIVEYNDRKMND
ncbi:MAG TPA: MarR family transcriptional regulator [Cyclobacteriaceae bacterium]|nr:MarR family transcriptional regulator [Cyclobacteriaceae bacterium]